MDEWRDADDQAVEFGKIPLEEGELLPAGALNGEPPDEKRVTEATGNEGATYERAYHRAALVLWPEDRMVDVLLSAGVEAALPHLTKLAARGEKGRPEALTAARRLVEAWQTADRGRYGFIGVIEAPKVDGRATMLGLLTSLQAADLVETFIRETVTASYDGTENAALTAAAGVLDGEVATALYAELVTARMAAHPVECAELLRALGGVPSLQIEPIARAAVAVLEKIGKPVKPEAWQPMGRSRRRAMAPEFVADLFAGLRRVAGGELCEETAEKLLARPNVFGPVALLTPALELLCAGAEREPAVERAMRRLWAGAAAILLGRSETAPPAPTDWRQQAEIDCKCEDCAKLQAFAIDPEEQVVRFRVNADRRGHLHRAIDQHKLAMTHVTERKGSPQTLVCTKDRREYAARMKEYRSEIAAMGKLVELRQNGLADGALLARMEAAIRVSAS